MTAIEKIYGHQLRVRACGILVVDKQVLLVNHKGLNVSNNFWSPPGGGMNFGESTEQALKREFFEETGLNISVDGFLFVHEFLKPPFHAIELFFQVSTVNNSFKTGIDPELSTEHQIIKEVAFLDFEMLKNEPKENLHQALHQIDEHFGTFKQKGYFKSH